MNIENGSTEFSMDIEEQAEGALKTVDMPLEILVLCDFSPELFRHIKNSLWWSLVFFRFLGNDASDQIKERSRSEL